MSDHSRRAKGDWAAFEAPGRDLEGRAEALQLEREVLAAQVEPLELAVERGMVEYKQSLADEAFRALEDARFRSLSSAQILGIASYFGVYAYVCTIQRQMADGTIVIRDHHRESDAPASDSETDIKQIIAEVQERVKTEPDLRLKQPVKNILMQLSRYSRELAQFKEVTVRTPADKRPPIAANFKKSSEEIFASIRRNYDQLAQEEKTALSTQPQHILLRLPINKLAGDFLSQAKAAVDVRAAILFARDEQRGARERLVETAGRHGAFVDRIDAEYSAYLELGQTDNLARQISRAFAQEVKKKIERETEVY